MTIKTGLYCARTVSLATPPYIEICLMDGEEKNYPVAAIVFAIDDEAHDRAECILKALNERPGSEPSLHDYAKGFLINTAWAQPDIEAGTLSVADREKVWAEYYKLFEPAMRLEPIPSRPLLTMWDRYREMIPSVEYDYVVFLAKHHMSKYYGKLTSAERTEVEAIRDKARNQIIHSVVRKNAEWRDWATKEIQDSAEYRLNGEAFAMVMPWVESERGWGVRPDGFSIHRTAQDMHKFIKDFNDTMPDEVPDTYSRPHGPATGIMITAHINNMIGWGSGVFFGKMDDIKDPMLDKE